MPEFAYPLVAIRDNGETITATGPEEAAAFNALRPGAHHRQQHLYIACISGGVAVWRESALGTYEWIVRDAYGAVVLHEDLPRSTVRRPGVLRRWLYEAQDAAARGLPIPRTGRRHRYSQGYRSFRKNIAMRCAEAGLEDDLADWGVEHIHVGRVRTHRLPRVWDDVAWRSDRRCWKDYRQTQYR